MSWYIISPLKTHIITRIQKSSVSLGKRPTVSTSLQKRVKEAEEQLMQPEGSLEETILQTKKNIP